MDAPAVAAPSVGAPSLGRGAWPGGFCHTLDRSWKAVITSEVRAAYTVIPTRAHAPSGWLAGERVYAWAASRTTRCRSGSVNTRNSCGGAQARTVRLSPAAYSSVPTRASTAAAAKVATAQRRDQRGRDQRRRVPGGAARGVERRRARRPGDRGSAAGGPVAAGSATASSPLEGPPLVGSVPVGSAFAGRGTAPGSDSGSGLGPGSGAGPGSGSGGGGAGGTGRRASSRTTSRTAGGRGAAGRGGGTGSSSARASTTSASGSPCLTCGTHGSSERVRWPAIRFRSAGPRAEKVTGRPGAAPRNTSSSAAVNGVGVSAGPASIRRFAWTAATRKNRRRCSNPSRTRAALPAKQQSRTTTICRAGEVASTLSTVVSGTEPTKTCRSPGTVRAPGSCNHSSSPENGTAPCPAK